MEEKTPETFKDLNEELLKPSVDESDEPRRNSKEWLIQRVLLLCEENQLELTMSNSKLKRLGKTQLQKLLAELTEESIKNQMAAAVQAPSTDERVMAVATLRMLHDTLANGCELGLNRWLPQHGYELDGFTKGFKEPKTSQIVDDCLREIAEESDILQYIESPYARLGLCWTTCLMMSVRPSRPKKRVSFPPYKQTDASLMEPRKTRQQNPVQPRPGGRPPTRKVDSGDRPATANVRTV